MSEKWFCKRLPQLLALTDWQGAAGRAGQHHPNKAQPRAAKGGEQSWVNAGDLFLLRGQTTGQVHWDEVKLESWVSRWRSGRHRNGHRRTSGTAQANSKHGSISLNAASEQRQGRHLLSFPRTDCFVIKAGPEPRQPNPAEAGECPQGPDSGCLWRLGKHLCSYLNFMRVEGEIAMFCTFKRNVWHCLPLGRGSADGSQIAQ